MVGGMEGRVSAQEGDSVMTPDDLATLPAWAADELRRQAEEIAALRAALEGAYSNIVRAMARDDYRCGEWSHLCLLQARASIALALGPDRPVDDAGRGV